MGMKARPSCEVDLYHLRVVRNEELCWLPRLCFHEETVEGSLHADEVSETEGSLTCSNSPVKGKGSCAPCRSRCRGGEQSEDEDESVHYESETCLGRALNSSSGQAHLQGFQDNSRQSTDRSQVRILRRPDKPETDSFRSLRPLATTIAYGG